MQKRTNLHIATPCHEDWNQMTATDAGRFCASCSKQVVDFTAMSDTQILQFLAGHKGELCGRFDGDQLNRPLVEPTLSKKKSWYLALALPFSLFFQKGFGQKAPRTLGKMAPKVEQKSPEPREVIVGAFVLPPVISEWVTLTGTLSDEKGMPVRYGTVTIPGTRYSCVADSAGRFSMKMRRGENSVMLAVSAVGYEPMERRVSVEEAETDVALTLSTSEAVLDSVVVTSYDAIRCRRVTGATSVFYKVSYTEKIDSTVRKVLRMNPVTVFPNPARGGGSLQMKYRKAGVFEVQLLSSASALLKTETVRVGSDGTMVSFQLPHVAAGMYYLRLIGGDLKNPYLEKILVVE